jgi:hypothetical protein
MKETCAAPKARPQRALPKAIAPEQLQGSLANKKK